MRSVLTKTYGILCLESPVAGTGRVFDKCILGLLITVSWGMNENQADTIPLSLQMIKRMTK